MKALIAVSKNVIGNGNKLPWSNKKDMKRFAMITNGKKLVMGYNTFMSLPEVEGVKLKGRIVHVLCSENSNVNLPDYVIQVTLDVLKDMNSCELLNDFICIGGMKTLNMLYDEGLITEADITWIHGAAEMELDSPVYFEGTFAKKIQESSAYYYEVRKTDYSVNIIESYKF